MSNNPHTRSAGVFQLSTDCVCSVCPWRRDCPIISCTATPASRLCITSAIACNRWFAQNLKDKKQRDLERRSREKASLLKWWLIIDIHAASVSSMLQLRIEPDVGDAQQSSMSGLPAFLTAGVPQQMAITARDAQGNLTAGADKVEVLIDSITEGGL